MSRRGNGLKKPFREQINASFQSAWRLAKLILITRAIGRNGWTKVFERAGCQRAVRSSLTDLYELFAHRTLADFCRRRTNTKTWGRWQSRGNSDGVIFQLGQRLRADLLRRLKT